MIALVDEFWKPLLVLLCGVLLWTFVRIENAHIAKLEAYNAQLTAQLALAQGAITQQNAAVLALQTKGKEQQETIEGLAAEAQRSAAKVVTRWKTKYLPQPVPVDCAAAVAVGAVNAASVAQNYLATSAP